MVIYELQFLELVLTFFIYGGIFLYAFLQSFIMLLYNLIQVINLISLNQ